VDYWFNQTIRVTQQSNVNQSARSGHDPNLGVNTVKGMIGMT